MKLQILDFRLQIELQIESQIELRRSECILSQVRSRGNPVLAVMLDAAKMALSSSDSWSNRNASRVRLIADSVRISNQSPDSSASSRATPILETNSARERARHALR
jgi:hypothetical protein